MKGCWAGPAPHPERAPHSCPHPAPRQGWAKPLLGLGRQQSPTAHLQVEAGVLHHPLSQRGDVDSPVALPREVEIVLAVLGEEPEKVLQRQVVVVSNLQGRRDRSPARQDPHAGMGPSSSPITRLCVVRGVLLVIGVREANACRGLQVEHVSNLQGEQRRGSSQDLLLACHQQHPRVPGLAQGSCQVLTADLRGE